jgi:hypothetical protein
MGRMRQHWMRWTAVAVAVLAAVTAVILLTRTTPVPGPAGTAAACTGGSALPHVTGGQLGASHDSQDGAVQLPASSGLRCLEGMTQISASQMPLWTSKDGDPPYSAQAVGLTGSLQQGFVLTPAVQKFGELYHGLTLPLPSSFTAAHPGPAEVYVDAWALRDSATARMVMNNPLYNNEQAPLSSGGVHGGLVWSVWSQANANMQEFMFKFVRGHDLVQVNVVGAQLTLAQAQRVAQATGG